MVVRLKVNRQITMVLNLLKTVDVAIKIHSPKQHRPSAIEILI